MLKMYECIIGVWGYGYKAIRVLKIYKTLERADNLQV